MCGVYETIHRQPLIFLYKVIKLTKGRNIYRSSFYATIVAFKILVCCDALKYVNEITSLEIAVIIQLYFIKYMAYDIMEGRLRK